MADDEAVAGGGPGRARRAAPGSRAAGKGATAPAKKAGPAAKRPAAARIAPATAKAPAPVRRAPVRKAVTDRAATAGAAAPVPKGPPAKAAARKAVAPGLPGRSTVAPRKAVTRRTGSATSPEPVVPPRFAGSRLAAEQTFADDPPPPPTSPADDPSARVRGLLRSAAASIRAQEAAAGSASVYGTGYPSTTAPLPTPFPPAASRRTAAREPVQPEPVEFEADEAEPLEPEADEAELIEAEPTVIVPFDPEPEPVEDELVEPEPTVLVAPRRRVLRLAPPEPVAEAEWHAEDQPLEEEQPAADRIPDALDVLSVPGADAPATSRSAVRRFPPASPPPPPPVAPTAPRPAQDAPAAAPTAVIEPPVWTPPPAKPEKSGRSGGSGRSRSALRVLAAVVVIAILAAVVVAVIAGRKSGTDYAKLKVGDCFDASKSNQVRGIDVKSCAQSHNSEVFFLVTHPAGPKDPYPGKDALVQFAADACLGKPLTDYIGTPLEQSKYKDFEIVPQESAWKDGRRTLVCGIDTGGQGPVKGSAKVAKPAS